MGLREVESSLFEKLLKRGESSASELAAEIGVSRRSVYDLLDTLIDKGVVTQGLRGGTRVFSVQPFEKMRLLIEEKQQQLKRSEEALSDLQRQYEKKIPSQAPDLQIFKGRLALQQMMKDMLLYRNEHVISYWPIGKVAELLTKEFFEEFHRQRIRLGITVDMIWPHDEALHKTLYSHLDKTYFEGIRVRIAPKGINFSLGYTVYGNTVRFISSKKESFGFLIQSSELAEMMRGQFSVLWGRSTQPKNRQ